MKILPRALALLATFGSFLSLSQSTFAGEGGGGKNGGSSLEVAAMVRGDLSPVQVAVLRLNETSAELGMKIPSTNYRTLEDIKFIQSAIDGAKDLNESCETAPSEVLKILVSQIPLTEVRSTNLNPDSERTSTIIKLTQVTPAGIAYDPAMLSQMVKLESETTRKKISVDAYLRSAKRDAETMSLFRGIEKFLK